jgi:hypothetical protein
LKDLQTGSEANKRKWKWLRRRSFFMLGGGFIMGMDKSGLNWQYGGKTAGETLKGADEKAFRGR